jgi:hypothetical protein
LKSNNVNLTSPYESMYITYTELLPNQVFSTADTGSMGNLGSINGVSPTNTSGGVGPDSVIDSIRAKLN